MVVQLGSGMYNLQELLRLTNDRQEVPLANLLSSSVCAMFACLGLGVGGNLPVDGALFLEFLPFASGNLLTMLSVWWPVGQLVAR